MAEPIPKKSKKGAASAKSPKAKKGKASKFVPKEKTVKVNPKSKPGKAVADIATKGKKGFKKGMIKNAPSMLRA